MTYDHAKTMARNDARLAAIADVPEFLDFNAPERDDSTRVMRLSRSRGAADGGFGRSPALTVWDWSDGARDGWLVELQPKWMLPVELAVGGDGPDHWSAAVRLAGSGGGYVSTGMRMGGAGDALSALAGAMKRCGIFASDLLAAKEETGRLIREAGR